MEYLYTAWFRDPYADPEDQDYEWPACFVVTADDKEAALAWGNHLSERRSKGFPAAIFLSSEIEFYNGNKVEGEFVPVVGFGQEVDNEYIGW